MHFSPILTQRTSFSSPSNCLLSNFLPLLFIDGFFHSIVIFSLHRLPHCHYIFSVAFPLSFSPRSFPIPFLQFPRIIFHISTVFLHLSSLKAQIIFHIINIYIFNNFSLFFRKAFWSPPFLFSSGCLPRRHHNSSPFVSIETFSSCYHYDLSYTFHIVIAFSRQFPYVRFLPKSSLFPSNFFNFPPIIFYIFSISFCLLITSILITLPSMSSLCIFNILSPFFHNGFFLPHHFDVLQIVFHILSVTFLCSSPSKAFSFHLHSSLHLLHRHYTF